MSYYSLSQQIVDLGLMARIDACCMQEAWNDPELSQTDFGKAVKIKHTQGSYAMGWPVCLATEKEYEQALDAGTKDPGIDPKVIGDAEILVVVKANWPPYWPPPVTPPPITPPDGMTMGGVPASALVGPPPQPLPPGV